jgi:predicted DNA binding CopG/RHH family protein
MKTKIPTFGTDRETHDFVDAADLTEYDLSGGTRVQFEFEQKSANLDMRVPKPLLDAVKERSKVRDIPYTPEKWRRRPSCACVSPCCSRIPQFGCLR